MQIRFKAVCRKDLAKAISEIVGAKTKYLGVPSCAYQVGCFIIDKEGTLNFNDSVGKEETEKLLEDLNKRGYAYESSEDYTPRPKVRTAETNGLGFIISMPMELYTPGTWENLNNILKAKGALIQKALGLEYLPEVTEEEGKATFPWFSKIPDKLETVEAYCKLVGAIGKMARSQKRVTSKEKTVDNEKYAFRCFLLRLGFIGAEFKEIRKVLLKNFEGSSAFKGGPKNVISK